MDNNNNNNPGSKKKASSSVKTNNNNSRTPASSSTSRPSSSTLPYVPTASSSNNYWNNSDGDGGSRNKKKTRKTSTQQDEAYAQALQEEYRQDFLRRQAKKNKYNAMRQQQEHVKGPSNTTLSSASRSRGSLEPSNPTTVIPVASAPTEDLLLGPRAAVASSASATATSRSKTKHNNNTSVVNDDEWYTREWQAELDREEMLVQQRKQSLPPSNNRTSYPNTVAGSVPSVPPVNFEWDYHNDTNIVAARGVAATTVAGFGAIDSDPSYKIAQELQDEEYARQLQAQEQQRSQSRSSFHREQEQQQLSSISTNTNYQPSTVRVRTQSQFLDERTASNMSEDEAAAWRIQQELQDADYAQRLSVLEQQQAATAARNATVSYNNGNNSRSCMRRIVPLLICGVIIAIVPVLFVTGVFDTNDVPILGDIFGDSDPWKGNTTATNSGQGPTVDDSTAYAWPNRGNGLTLEILNACSDDWQVYVTEAISNWDQGAPIDSLTLITERIAYESACSTVDGKLKICNGNYGDTRWRGLNEVLLTQRNNRIVSSTARLNEYYLSRESDAQKLYTACHEIGHGFGLPHWDEDFFNADLGNCMDYTQRPSENSKPDESNFEYLAQLYGGRTVETDSSTESTTAVEESVPPDRRQRWLRRQHQQQMKKKSQLIDVIPFHEQRRVLHVSDHHEVHLVPSDKEGYMILQQYLLALPTK